MEVLAAIGLASNILQFIELGYKVVRHSRDLYSSGKDATPYNEALEATTKEMSRLSCELEQRMAGQQMTDDKKALLVLSKQCHNHSVELLTLLGRLKNKSPTSFRKSVQVIFRDIRKRDEKARLEQTLDRLRKQMNTVLNKLTRDETLEELRNIHSVSHSILQRNDSILEMLRNLDTTQNESQKRLQSIFRTYNDNLSQTLISTIITALDVRELNQRFEEVSKAHASTFEWLLADPNAVEEANLEGGGHYSRLKHEANVMFVDWLRSGDGIYHISGKPGAGKSTLVKFICQSPKTMEYLQQWCGVDSLVLIKSFFWRQGVPSQKNLTGLMRSILYQALSICPDLALLAAGSHEQSMSEIKSKFSADDNVLDAFERLLSDPLSFKGRRFVLFIDGLDEFEGRHLDLVNKLNGWAEQHQGSLKICVSSREWNEFMVGFAQRPKLQIHYCTEEDIRKFVHDKLHSLQQHLITFDFEEMDVIEQIIIRKAEGVFVWVRLALSAVEDGVLNGDSISDVRKRISTFPRELDDLYQVLFDSIKEHDRQKSFEMLRLTHYLNSDRGLPLRHYVFLDRIMAEPGLATSMEIATTPLDLPKLLQATRRQVYGRCKGFLEVCPSDIWSDHEDGEVRFMHSTVHEFLSQPHVKRVMDEKVGHVDHLQRICYMMLASIKHGCPDAYWHWDPTFRTSPFVHALGEIMGKESELRRYQPMNRCDDMPAPGTWFLAFLQDLEAEVVARLSAFGPEKYERVCMMKLLWLSSATVTVSVPSVATPEVLIQLLAAQFCLYEFLESKDLGPLIAHCQSPPTERPSFVSGLLSAGSSMAIFHYPSYVRLLETMQRLLEAGLSSNHPYAGFHQFTIFDCLIYWHLLSPRKDWASSTSDYREIYRSADLSIAPFQLLYLCLRYGATSRMEIRFGPCYRPKEVGSATVVQMWPNERGTTRALDLDREWPMYHPIKGPLISLAMQSNGILRADDILRLWFPEDHEVLLRLLKENEAQDEAIQLPHPTSDGYCVERDYSRIEFGQPLIDRQCLRCIQKDTLNTEYEVTDYPLVDGM